MNAALAKDGKLWIAWPTDNRVAGYYHRPLRQQVYAGVLPAPRAVAERRIEDSAARDASKRKPGHADEAGDLRAIRGYTAHVGGKPHHILRGDFHRHTELSWDGGGDHDGSCRISIAT